VSTSTGYRVVYCPDHPRAWSTGYVYVHQIVAEAKLGRLLRNGEVCHHEDENRRNNSPDNISIMARQDHAREHGRAKGKSKVRLRCPQCESVFVRETRQTHLRKPSKLRATCCSRACRGKLSQRVQGEGITPATQAAIEGNVVEHFREP
jgi:hypothetical protein